MKKYSVLLAIIVTLLSLTGKAQALPMYYTFSGWITYLQVGEPGIIADAGLSVEDPISYTFIVDLDAPGSVRQNSGTVTTTSDVVYDSFYDDYYSGDALTEKDGGFYNAASDIAEYNYGYQCFSLSPCGFLLGNSGDDIVQISSDVLPVHWWIIYDTVWGINKVYDSTGAYETVYSQLSLIDISPVNVPEPSTLLLVMIGILGLLAFNRRKKTGQRVHINRFRLD